MGEEPFLMAPSALALEDIEMAKRELEQGKIGLALANLDRALTESHDPEVIKLVHELAEQAYPRESFIQRHTIGKAILKASAPSTN
jgi:hypothetical protein